MDEFIDWYCSDRGSRSIVVWFFGYWMQLETQPLAPETINFRLAAAGGWSTKQPTLDC